MAHKVPVIGSKIGGTNEMITDGQNGFLVNPEDRHEFAEKTVRILSSKMLKQKFVKNGLETCKRFSPELMVKKTIKLYSKL